ncbi:MAG: trypsin-like peptidase domain-containing protein [Verrucomicrobiota bacterium]
MKTQFSRRGTNLKGWAWLGAMLLSAAGLPAVLTPTATEVDIRRDATVAAIERVTPSVVNIRTSKLVQRNTLEDEIRRRYFGWKNNAPAAEEINNIGSGVIIDATEDEGYILTNFHVLQQAQRVQVQLWDGREYRGRAVAQDEPEGSGAAENCAQARRQAVRSGDDGAG